MVLARRDKRDPNKAYVVIDFKAPFWQGLKDCLIIAAAFLILLWIFRKPLANFILAGLDNHIEYQDQIVRDFRGY